METSGYNGRLTGRHRQTPCHAAQCLTLGLGAEARLQGQQGLAPGCPHTKPALALRARATAGWRGHTGRPFAARGPVWTQRPCSPLCPHRDLTPRGGLSPPVPTAQRSPAAGRPPRPQTRAVAPAALRSESFSCLPVYWGPSAGGLGRRPLQARSTEQGGGPVRRGRPEPPPGLGRGPREVWGARQVFLDKQLQKAEPGLQAGAGV